MLFMVAMVMLVVLVMRVVASRGVRLRVGTAAGPGPQVEGGELFV